jgi:hypothetical protein
MDVLSKTKDLRGDVLEIGCYLGGTAALSVKMLDAIGIQKDYTVIDTFEGFEKAQFAYELTLGAKRSLINEFSSNSPSLTRWVLNRHGAERVKIIQGNISKLPESQLPESVSACLLDVDLAAPIYDGLKKIYPRLVVGGIIAVDDCENVEGGYKAKLGYERFIAEMGMEPEFKYGMGLVTKTRESS